MTRSYFIARGRVLRIEKSAHSVLHVRRGALWVTQEGDSRDYYLAAGHSLRLDNDGLALAQATQPSTVALVPGEEGPANLTARIGRLWAALFAPHARPTTAAF